jgi:hypothetical protein
VTQDGVECYKASTVNWKEIIDFSILCGDSLADGDWKVTTIPSKGSYGLQGTGYDGNRGTLTIELQNDKDYINGEEHTVGIKAARIVDDKEDLILYASFSASLLHPGEDAVSYQITGYPGVLIRHINSDNTISPNSFTLTSTCKAGSGKIENIKTYWKLNGEKKGSGESFSIETNGIEGENIIVECYLDADYT